MPSNVPIAPDDAVLSACKAVGIAAFFDPGDRLIYAHPADVPQSKALAGMHVMIAIEEASFLSAEAPPVRVSAWGPDGSSDAQELGTVYASDGAYPITEEAARCAQATAEWFAGRTAGFMLLEALTDYGITPADGLSITYASHSDTYDVPLPLPRDEFARLVIADRNGSVRHVPSVHTGWSIMLHDERGEPVGDPVYITGNGRPVECSEDSAAAAAFIADFVTAPFSRHCDCYAQDGHSPRHDRECNRYRRS
ncbi:hypothetical protein [Streptomyces venezuelae]|uniref:hypothetical protein n=1 Tax=Streptomyces venezuelae TaxID=54571 RepID=UPI0034470D46